MTLGQSYAIVGITTPSGRLTATSRRPLIILLAALLLVSAPARAQTPAPAPAPIPLRPLFDLIRGWSPEHGAIYNLTFGHHDRQLLTAEQVWSRLADARGSTTPIDQAPAAFAVGYRDALQQTFTRVSGPFINTDPELPLLVGAHRDQVAVVLEGFAHEDVFNTLRTTPRSRGLDVARARVLSALRSAEPLCHLSGIGFVGIEVIYGTKNFLDRGTESLKAEVVTVVAPTAACRRFIAGELSDDELLKVSDVYLHDRDSDETRKVTLSSSDAR